MKSNRLKMLVLFLCGLCLCSCSRGASFEEEYQLSIRAGKGELSASEHDDLLGKNHPIIMQISDPGTAALINGFARLPPASHDVLRSQGYLKWNYADLPASCKAPFLSLVQGNLALARGQGVQPVPGFSLKALNRGQVGYTVVSIDAEKDQKVVSLYILWPELPNPTWVTVVNAKLAGTEEYFKAHLMKLRLLVTAKASPLPS
ncbi:MAG: hypothetical protein V1736_12455 [Pseudomonadota bacterium]